MIGARRRASGRREEGAALVEIALVATLVFTIFLAMFEFGLLFRDSLTVTDAVSDATRIAAVIGPDIVDGTNADFAAVRAVREGLASLNDDQIQTIVVFKSGGGGSAVDQVPVACRNGNSLAGICNAYDATAAFNAIVGGDTGYFECPTGGTPSSDPACGWDPEDRQDGPTSADVETVGVYVLVERGGYTGLFGNSWTISRASTLRLEPGVIES